MEKTLKEFLISRRTPNCKNVYRQEKFESGEGNSIAEKI